MVGEIDRLIDERKAPRNALRPIPIRADNLFSLDVDDDIWQDIGLNEDDDCTEPPPWLSDENVRKGIRAMLDLDRCSEEEPRLILERRSLQEWFSEEWAIVNSAIDATGELSLSFDCLIFLVKIMQLHVDYSTNSNSVALVYCGYALAGRNLLNH